jgi:hypothetical protein
MVFAIKVIPASRSVAVGAGRISRAFQPTAPEHHFEHGMLAGSSGCPLCTGGLRKLAAL